jgi:polyisoprenoid-binding protein YceI
MSTSPTTTTTTTLNGDYTIDPTHSRIGFVARHAMVTKVRGSFNEFTGTGFLDIDDPAKSKIDLTIQTASIDTRNADRDATCARMTSSTWTRTRRSASCPPRPAVSTTTTTG